LGICDDDHFEDEAIWVDGSSDRDVGLNGTEWYQLQFDNFCLVHDLSVIDASGDEVKVFASPKLCRGVKSTACEISSPRMADVMVHGTFAMPTDDSDLDHLEFVLAIDNGPRIYISGDTDYADLLGHVAKLEPDVMITCMNGGFNNLSHWEAAGAASMIKPKVAIPCHYDMFASMPLSPNSSEPACVTRPHKHCISGLSM
jgi:L-ascorbate metabolism protein UlaG (beta-lactamase superfamily)